MQRALTESVESGNTSTVAGVKTLLKLLELDDAPPVSPLLH